jgi:hypothetical protein
MTLVTIYFQALLCLYSFAMNGAVVTWTLPGVHSTYVAFLSLFQIAFLALGGIALAGVAALAAGTWSVLRRQRAAQPQDIATY